MLVEIPAMSDDEGEEAAEEPAIELGEGPDVEGAPLARVASRLSWGIERSTIIDREGDAVIRTPDGPQELATIVEQIDTPYFEKRQEFEAAVREVIGDGPVQTAE
jgi:hypothetical protein